MSTTTVQSTMPKNKPFDRNKERPIPLSQTRELGSDRTRETLRNWALKGVKSRHTGKVVQLEAIYIGAILYSSREAYSRFLDRLNGLVS